MQTVEPTKTFSEGNCFFFVFEGNKTVLIGKKLIFTSWNIRENADPPPFVLPCENPLSHIFSIFVHPFSIWYMNRLSPCKF